jgi:hypothetical protein
MTTLHRLTILAIALLSFAGVLAGQSEPEPRPGDTVGWHEVRAGETLSGITERYLGVSTLWPENHRLNPSITDPDRLKVGQRVRVILNREIAARRAEVEKVSRRVERKPTADDWTTARAGDLLVEREGLRTYPKSSAELGFDDGSNLVLTENSIVFLREYSSSLRRVDRSLIEVVDGGIDVAVTPKTPDRRAKDIEIVLGDVTARPRAETSEPAKTRAVRDEESRAAKLMVYAGAGEVEAAGVKVAVAKGMGTSVAPGAAPAPPERLLPAPKLVSPPSGARAANAVEVSWAAVKGAASYTLEVCRDEACARLVERRTGIASTSAATPTLPAGELFWRVTAKSASGLDGYPAAPFALTIARELVGRVMLDGAGTMDAASWTGITGAVVRLHLDDGDGVPGAGDAAAAETRSDETGRFRFDGAGNGTYWLVVDSRSASPEGTWVEQVAGPAGSLCADGAGGTTTLAAAGPCYGGRRGDASDDASSAATAEHVVHVGIGDELAPGPLDLVFSPSVVTTTADAALAPQGSLRQFLANAAATAGESAMRFVPAVPAVEGTAWWTIALVEALPPVERSVTLDGRAWSRTGELLDVNAGVVSLSRPVGAAGEALAVADRPELEIDANGASRALVVGSGTLRVRHLAVFGARDAELSTSGRLEVENSVVGTDARISAPQKGAATVIEVSGSGVAELARVHVRAAGARGIHVRSETAEAKVVARDVEIAGCTTVAAVRIESSGSSFERVHVSPCLSGPARIGFELKGTRGVDGRTCRDNRIVSSTVSGHPTGVRLRVGANDNVVEGNAFESVTRGVELDLVMGFWVPKGNSIRRNAWRAYAEPIALAGLDGVAGRRPVDGAAAVSCVNGGWSADRPLDFPGSISVARDGQALQVSAKVCPDVTVDAYLDRGGVLEHLRVLPSDASGGASERVDIADDVTRIGFTATDERGTTSRMTFVGTGKSR